jgi:hypothetical protein
MWDQEKYQKAITFAGFAHRNQLVPGKEYNYVVHISLVSRKISGGFIEKSISTHRLNNIAKHPQMF